MALLRDVPIDRLYYTEWMRWVRCRETAGVAYRSVEVPDAVIDVLTSLRDYLQDKCEPPVYVSDRRFMKSIQMLQVAAHADGRTAVGADSVLAS